MTENGIKGFRGTVFTLGDAGYDDARTIFNSMIDKRPAYIAGCTDAADVVTALAARRQGLPLRAKRWPQRRRQQPRRGRARGRYAQPGTRCPSIPTLARLSSGAELPGATSIEPASRTGSRPLAGGSPRPAWRA